MAANPTVPIRDGVYKFINVDSKGHVLDLLDGRALGPIVGSKDVAGSESQKWEVQNISKGRIGGTVFILENVGTRGTYASASIQTTGAVLSGSPNPTIWIPVLAGDALQFVIPGPSQLWALSRDAEFAPVVLETTEDTGLGSLTRWKLERVDE